jgi:hypothetical protein
MKKYIAALAAISCLGGCASVFEGTSQNIAVNTNPANASCVFEREGAPIGTIPNTPGTLMVRKSKYDITIRCDKPGYEQGTYINHSGTTATIAANVAVDLVFTLGLSSIVDSATGADNKYDSVVNVMLAPVIAGTPGAAQQTGAAAPAAANTTAAASTVPAPVTAAPTVAPAAPAETSAPRKSSSIFNP